VSPAELPDRWRYGAYLVAWLGLVAVLVARVVRQPDYLSDALLTYGLSATLGMWAVGGFESYAVAVYLRRVHPEYLAELNRSVRADTWKRFHVYRPFTFPWAAPMSRLFMHATDPHADPHLPRVRRKMRRLQWQCYAAYHRNPSDGRRWGSKLGKQGARSAPQAPKARAARRSRAEPF
jgi:hypothetical protein